MKFTYQTPNGTAKTVDLNRKTDGTYSAVIDNRTYAVKLERSQAGTLLLTIGDQLFAVQTARSGATHYLAMNGQLATLEKVAAGNRISKAQSAGDLTASMPGQITQVTVAVGDRVEQGQTLIVMEAMKMEMRLKAPYDGIVKKLRVSVGATVDRGELLAEIVRDTDDPDLIA